MSAQITRNQENLKALKLYKTHELVKISLEETAKNNQPSIDKKRIKDLAACRFIDNGENVIFRCLLTT
jgi:hypothetical protein